MGHAWICNYLPYAINGLDGLVDKMLDFYSRDREFKPRSGHVFSVFNFALSFLIVHYVLSAAITINEYHNGKCIEKIYLLDMAW